MSISYVMYCMSEHIVCYVPMAENISLYIAEQRRARYRSYKRRSDNRRIRGSSTSSGGRGSRTRIVGHPRGPWGVKDGSEQQTRRRRKSFAWASPRGTWWYNTPSWKGQIVYASSQWETALQCNAASHWLGDTQNETAIIMYHKMTNLSLWM